MNTPFTFTDYQNSTCSTAIYPGQGTPLGLVYCSLKLAGEAGEVAENVGKAIRDDGLMDNNMSGSPAVAVLNQAICYMRSISPERREKLKKELGDNLWYIAQMCTELGLSMEEVAKANLDKLADRKARGVLQGSGDER